MALGYGLPPCNIDKNMHAKALGPAGLHVIVHLRLLGHKLYCQSTLSVWLYDTPKESLRGSMGNWNLVLDAWVDGLIRKLYVQYG